MLCAMTDHLAALSIPPAPPASSKPKFHVKLQNPNLFNGSDLSKFNMFLFQCNLYIMLHSQDFPDDTH